MLSKTGSLYDAIHAHTTNPKQLMSLSIATQVSECPVSLSLSASQEENLNTL